jgi:hypothetical protein
MVGPRKDGEIDPDHLVTDQFVDEGVRFHQRVSGDSVKPVHELAELGRRHSLGEVRGAAYVHEEQGQVHFRTPRVRAADLESEVAKARIPIVLPPTH